MKAIAIAAVIVLLQAAPALAQGKPAARPKPNPLPKSEPAKAAGTCAEYGAGFVRIGETATCVKIGGYVRMQSRSR